MADSDLAAGTGRDDEQTRVNRWRLHELLEAGYPLELADLVAVRHDIDLHQAVDLAHQCGAALAARILL